MEFRDDGPSLTKGPPCPHHRHRGMTAIPLRALGSSYISQFLLMTFHLLVLEGMEKECPLRGSSGPPKSVHLQYAPSNTQQHKGLLSVHLLHSLPMLSSLLSLPLRGPQLPWAKVSKNPAYFHMPAMYK